MLKYVYNKEIENREPYIIDLYPDRDGLSWFAIYHKAEGEIYEWDIKATNINEALGAFFVENPYAEYFEIVDHVELA